MITAGEARIIAEKALADAFNDDDLVIGDNCFDRPHHWVFVFQSALYWATRDPFRMLAGNSPIAVSKIDGGVTWLGTAMSIEAQLP